MSEENEVTQSPAFLAMRERLAAKRAGNGDSEENKKITSNPNMKYYKSHSPSFNVIYNVTGFETVHIRFKNSVYFTDNKDIQKYLQWHYIRRNYIVEISEEEYKNNTSIQRVQPERSFADVSETTPSTIKVGMAGSEDIVK